MSRNQPVLILITLIPPLSGLVGRLDGDHRWISAVIAALVIVSSAAAWIGWRGELDELVDLSMALAWAPYAWILYQRGSAISLLAAAFAGAAIAAAVMSRRRLIPQTVSGDS